MLVPGHHVFSPETPVGECARLAALFEAVVDGRVRIKPPLPPLLVLVLWYTVPVGPLGVLISLQ